MQKTVIRDFKFEGIALHSGRHVRVRVRPAGPNEGIVFYTPKGRVAARFDNVVQSPLCTLLASENAEVSTVEHFMAAAYALGITNLRIEISGSEMPIMDGSAKPFVNFFLAAGMENQRAPRKSLRVNAPVAFEAGDSVSTLKLAGRFSVGVEIAFAASAIGRQSYVYGGDAKQFVADISRARTFCMSNDIAMMQMSGKAKGGSMENAVVFDDDRVLNPEGLRMPNEPVVHKALDAIGDLALIGADLIGSFQAFRPGHRNTNQLLRKAVACGALSDMNEQLADGRCNKIFADVS